MRLLKIFCFNRRKLLHLKPDAGIAWLEQEIKDFDQPKSKSEIGMCDC